MLSFQRVGNTPPTHTTQISSPLTTTPISPLPKTSSETTPYTTDKLPTNSTTHPSNAPQDLPIPKFRHIWLVTGPAGCGKSTVGQYIANAMKFPFIEGDKFHPPSNIQKMSNGIPLTDSDRWDWLTILREEAIKTIKTHSNAGVVLACSALKRKYRDVIRVAAYFDHDIRVHFIYLRASEEELQRRVAMRRDHYMGANMVHSQFSALEEPGEEEMVDVEVVGVDGGVEVVERRAVEVVRRLVEMEGDGGMEGDGEMKVEE